MDKYIVALDIGTNNIKVVIFNQEAQACSVIHKHLNLSYPKIDWVEINPIEILNTSITAIQQAMNQIGIKADDVATIGIANQRETTILWDKNTGQPVCNAIVWQCKRTKDICDSIIEKDLNTTIHKKTGLIVDPYFSSTKIQWILDNINGVKEQALNGNILFGTVDSWIIWNLSKDKIHITDYSNASRTMLFNINTLEWDSELIKEFNIPRQILPKVEKSSQMYCTTDKKYFGSEIPISSAIGDQQASLFGLQCFNEGDTKNTYGTGCFILMNTGKEKIFSDNGLLTTIAWNLNGEITYALEGSIFVAADALSWLTDDIKLIDNVENSDYYASLVKNTNGCYFVPAFSGLGAPYWDPHARGTIVGLTQSVKKPHLIRATLESIAYRTFDVMNAMLYDSNIEIQSLKADGSACKNNTLMQIQADIIDTPVHRSSCVNTTSAGTAYLAGLAVGVWDNIEEIKENFCIDRTFYPSITQSERMMKLRGWDFAVKYARDWAKYVPS